MTVVTFGDFLRQADEHVEHSKPFPAEIAPDSGMGSGPPDHQRPRPWQRRVRFQSGIR